MEKYQKPCIASQRQVNGIVPLAALASVEALSVAATAAGVLLGLSTSNSKGGDILPVDSGLKLQE